MTAQPKSETDLAKRVIDWLIDQHWDVYQEVNFSWGGGVADIAAVQAGKLWIIECKTSMTFSVLEQATRWRSHFRSIAIPHSNTKGREISYDIARNYLKVGVITIDGQWSGFQGVRQVSDPPLMREYHKYAKHMIATLKPEHKTTSAAGSKGGGYYTPYRSTMTEVQQYIRWHPGCTLKEIMDSLEHHHYSSNKSAYGGIRTALDTWEKNWCKTQIDEKGVKRYYEYEVHK